MFHEQITLTYFLGIILSDLLLSLIMHIGHNQIMRPKIMQVILRNMHGKYFSHAPPFYMDIVPAKGWFPYGRYDRYQKS